MWGACLARAADSFATRALALQPDEAEALLAQGHVAVHQRAYPRAEGVFGRALKAHPDNTRVRRGLGNVLSYQRERLPEALTVLQEAVRRDPRDALAHYDLAVAWALAGNSPAAWEEYDAAIKVKPFAEAPRFSISECSPY